MAYIKPTKIKTYVTSKGKRTSKDFLLWLDIQVQKILDREINALGPTKKTLNMEDSETLAKLKKHI